MQAVKKFVPLFRYKEEREDIMHMPFCGSFSFARGRVAACIMINGATHRWETTRPALYKDVGRIIRGAVKCSHGKGDSAEPLKPSDAMHAARVCEIESWLSGVKLTEDLRLRIGWALADHDNRKKGD